MARSAAKGLPYHLDAAARAEVLARHEALVWSMTYRANASLGRVLGAAQLEDVAGAVRLALVRAAAGFDPKLGWQFTTYSYRLAARAAHRAARAEVNRGVHVPDHMPTTVAVCSADEAGEGGGPSLAAAAPDHREPRPGEVAPAGEVWEAVRRVLGRREYRILRMKYLAGKTAREIGARLGVSGEMVRQIQKRAEEKVRCRLPNLAGGV
jgi:RNA polymerase sigma factor (sigma-70 family)